MIAPPSSKIQPLVLGAHLFVAWVFFLSSLGLLFLPFWVAAPLVTSLIPEQLTGTVIAVAVVGGIAAIVLLVFLAVHLFLRLWFRYLKRLSPAHAAEVERVLPSVLNVAAFEPQYSRVRNQFLPKRSDA